MSADVVAASSDTVRVLVRIRPPNARERDSGYVEAARAHADARAVTLARSARESVKTTPCQSFAFDGVCDREVSQREIFERVGRDAVDGAVEKSCSVNVMDERGTKIVGRRRGMSAEACVNVIAASRENGRGLPPTATRRSACSRAERLGEIKDGKDILRACAPACRAACEKGLGEYEEEQRETTGFGLNARAREKVRKACVVTCGKDCAKAGKSYDFIIPFRFD